MTEATRRQAPDERAATNQAIVTHPTPPSAPDHLRDNLHTPPTTKIKTLETHINENPIELKHCINEIYFTPSTNQPSNVTQYSPYVNNTHNNPQTPKSTATLSPYGPTHKTQNNKRKHFQDKTSLNLKKKINF